MSIQSFEGSLHAYANGALLVSVYAVRVTRTADAITVTLRALKATDQDAVDVYPFAVGDEVTTKVQFASSGEAIELRTTCQSITVGYDVQSERKAMPYVEAVLVTREQPFPDWR